MVLFYSLVYPLLVAVVLVVTGRATVRLATLWWDTCRLSGVDVGELLAVDTGALGVGALASSDLTLLGLAKLRPELIPPPSTGTLALGAPAAPAARHQRTDPARPDRTGRARSRRRHRPHRARSCRLSPPPPCRRPRAALTARSRAATQRTGTACPSPVGPAVTPVSPR